MIQQFKDFEVGEQTYRAYRLSAFEQFSVVKIFAPVLSSVVASLENIPAEDFTDLKEAGSEIKGLLKDANKYIEPFIEALSKLDDEKLFDVCRKCLFKVKVRNSGGTGWSDVLADNGKFMFEELEYDLYAIGSILFEVIKFNLKGFTAALPSSLKDRASSLSERALHISPTAKIS